MGLRLHRRHLMRTGSVFAHLHMSGEPPATPEEEAAAEEAMQQHWQEIASTIHEQGLAFYHSVQQAGGLQQLTMASLRRTAGHTRNK